MRTLTRENSTGEAGPLLGAFQGIARGTRIHKVIPLVLLLVNAALFAHPSPWTPSLGLAVLYLLGVSGLGMQLNVLTDEQLDARAKPELARWMRAHPRALQQVMRVEVLACLSLLALMATASAWMAAAMAIYGCCYVLYSYNFLVPGAAGRSRLKVYWWGQLATVLPGYLALWVAGFALADLPGEAWPRWIALAAAVCLVDYGLFLNEAAGDASEEREHGLRTLPALLGARRTSGVGFAVSCAGAVAVVALSAYPLPLPLAVRLALAWHVGVQLIAASATYAVVRGAGAGWERLVDASFWLSRAGVLALLVSMR